MNIKALSILLIFGFHVCQAQIELPTEWTIRKSSSTNGMQAWGLDTDTEGNIYWPVSKEAAGEGLDIVTYKLDSDGDEVWDVPLFFGGVGAQQAYLARLVDDTLYIGGRECLITGFDCDILLLKYDVNAKDLLWSLRDDFGRPGYNEIDAMSFYPEGIVLAGWGQELQAGAYQIDMGFWKIGYDGEVQWRRSHGQLNSAEHIDGHTVQVDDAIYGTGIWGGTGVFNIFEGRSVLVKFSKEDGEIMDSVHFGRQDPWLNAENGLTLGTDGDFLYAVGYSTARNSDWQIFMSKFDFDLNHIWTKDYGASGTESARSVVFYQDRIFIGGTTESSEWTLDGSNIADAVLLEIDLDGNLIESYIYGGEDKEAIHDMKIHDGLLHISGSGTPASGGLANTAFLLQTSLDQIVAQTDLQPETATMVVRPNPSKDLATVDLNRVYSDIYFVITNMTGQTVSSASLKNKDQIVISDLDIPGIYHLKVWADGHVMTSRVVRM